MNMGRFLPDGVFTAWAGEKGETPARIQGTR